MEKTIIETLEEIVHNEPYFSDLSEDEKANKVLDFIQILIHH